MAEGMQLDTDVLIVGAGPTGSALAVDLLRRGVSVRIIEKNSHSFLGSRAKGVQPRSLEVLEDLGVISQIVKAGSLYPPLGIHVGPLRIPRKMFKNVEATPDRPYPNTWLIGQYDTDAILQKRVAELGGEVEFSTRFLSLSQGDDGVLAEIEGPSGIERRRYAYLIGADGGASPVRTALDIPFEGSTDEADRMIIVDCRIEGLGRDHWHVWPWIGGRFAGACPMPGGDYFQVMIRLQAGEQPDLDADALNARFRKQTGSQKLTLTDIRWTTVFRPNVRLAHRYRIGRVFLAGDAAHVHTPMGAQGLNTGLQDAYNLGWKLGQVLAGAPDALLDTYQDERQPVAAGVLGLSSAKYEALNKLDPSSFSRGKDEQQLGITYRAGPLGAEQKTDPDKLAPGDRAPDADLRDSDGKQVRLFELTIGPHFTLLGVGKAAEELANVTWPKGGAEIRRVAIDWPDAAAADVHVSDANGTFKNAYGTAGECLILLRPDGYIGRISAGHDKQNILDFARKVAP